jgi:PD-(D/E)XK endonuclease
VAFKKFFTCLQCGKESSSSWTLSKYCSTACRKERERKREYRVGKPYISTGKTGAIGELKVSCDLLDRGYEVFRSVSPDGSCDLVALKGDKMFRIEVKTGQVYATTGTRTYPKPKPKDANKFDILAVSYPDGIAYSPISP